MHFPAVGTKLGNWKIPASQEKGIVILCDQSGGQATPWPIPVENSEAESSYQPIMVQALGLSFILMDKDVGVETCLKCVSRSLCQRQLRKE